MPKQEQARWGHITRMKIEKEWEKLPKLGGGTYESGQYWEVWVLLCDCGHELKIREIDFPGKYTLRSCGRPECKYTGQGIQGPGRPPARIPAERGTIAQIYMPLSLYTRLVEKAQRDVRSVSKTAAELIRLGLDTAEAPVGTADSVPVTGEPTDW